MTVTELIRILTRIPEKKADKLIVIVPFNEVNKEVNDFEWNTENVKLLHNPLKVVN